MRWPRGTRRPARSEWALFLPCQPRLTIASVVIMSEIAVKRVDCHELEGWWLVCGSWLLLTRSVVHMDSEHLAPVA